MDTRDVPELRGVSAETFEKHTLFETDRMFADVYCFEPGQAQDPHAHDDADKVYYVLEGRGTFVVGDEEQALEAGRAVLAPAGERHGVENAGDERLRTLVFVARDHQPDDAAGHAHAPDHESRSGHDHGDHAHELPHDHEGEGAASDVAVITVSTSRAEGDDPGADDSGDAIEALVTEAGHAVPERTVVADDLGAIATAVEAAIADGADVVVTTGGTGLTSDDVTVEALRPLFDREIRGFGEEFRRRSTRQVGLAGLLSRATAGVVDETVVVALPGSEDAVRLGVGELLLPQLDHLLHLVGR